MIHISNKSESRFIILLTVSLVERVWFVRKSNMSMLTNKRGGNSGTIEKETRLITQLHRQHTQLPLLFVYPNPTSSSFLHAIVSSSCGDRLSRILTVHCPCLYCDRGFRWGNPSTLLYPPPLNGYRKIPPDLHLTGPFAIPHQSLHPWVWQTSLRHLVH